MPPATSAFDEPHALPPGGSSSSGTGGLGGPGAPASPVGSARDVYTVSRLVGTARLALERGLGVLWVEGEISNLSRPASGHWYFTLKDAGAQLRCAM